MAENSLNIRVAAKYGIATEFNNTIPEKGEMIIYNLTEDSQIPYLKVGDGITSFENLTPVSANINLAYQDSDTDLILGLVNADDFSNTSELEEVE